MSQYASENGLKKRRMLIEDNMSIFEETQKERDLELSSILKKSYNYVKNLEICSEDSIRIYNDENTIETEKDFISLYKEYKYLNLEAHLKTLMFTSIERRGKILKKLIKNTKNKKCLDFGSGVGSHTIALLEIGNEVDILDVNGPLLKFTQERIKRRGYKVNVFYNDSPLPQNEYDLVICTDVLEHVYDPIYEFDRIYLSLKKGGKLFLQVSNKIKPSSGHFTRSITLWNKEGIPKLNKKFTKISKDLYIR